VEQFNFELRLVSDIDKIAGRGAESLKKLEGGAKKTRETLDFSKPLEKIESQLHKLEKDPAGFIKMKKAAKELQEQQKKLLEGAGLAKGESFLSAMMGKLSFTKLASAAAVGDIVGEGVMKAGEMMVEAAHKFVEVITEGVTKAFEESSKQQVLRLGERLSLGGKGGKEYAEDVDRFSKLTGFDDDVIRKMLLGTRRAGYSQASARQQFATAADIAAGAGEGGNQAAISEVLGVFQHLKAKGGIGEKQLAGLIGNAGGQTVPNLYKDLAKELHISTETAKKRLEEGGKIDPQLVINAITRAVNKQQGGAAGTGAIAYSETLEARWARVQNLPNEFLKKLVDSPGFARAEEMLIGLLEKLDPESPAGLRIQAAIETMFDKITSLIGDPETAADNLSSTIENAVHLFGEAIDAASALADALVPSLNTIEDMVIGLREFVALQSGDKEGFKAALKQEADVTARRYVNTTVRMNKMAEKFNAKNVAEHANDNGALLAAPTDLAARILAAQQGNNAISDRAGTSGKGAAPTALHVTVAPGAVVVHKSGGETDDSAHKRAGQGLFEHIVRAATGAIEQAAQEAGG
jgi:hypothetical protein